MATEGDTVPITILLPILVFVVVLVIIIAFFWGFSKETNPLVAMVIDLLKRFGQLFSDLF